MVLNPSFIEISVPSCVSVTPVGAWVAPSTFSKGLTSARLGADRDSLFVWTIEDMRESWVLLRLDEVFCASLFLYNFGYRWEALYWYYSAWARLEWYLVSVAEWGEAAMAPQRVALAFCQGLRDWMRPFGYFFPQVFRVFKSRIFEDLHALNWALIYPEVSFLSASPVSVVEGFLKWNPGFFGDGFLTGLAPREDFRFRSLPSSFLEGGWVSEEVMKL